MTSPVTGVGVIYEHAFDAPAVKRKNLVLHIEVPAVWADDLEDQATELADGEPVTAEHRLDALDEWMRAEVGITLVSKPGEKEQNFEFEVHAYDGRIVGAELRELP